MIFTRDSTRTKNDGSEGERGERMDNGTIAKRAGAPAVRKDVAWLIRLYRRRIALNLRATDARLKLGLFLLDLGRVEKGVSVLRELLRLDPNNLRAREAIARAGSPPDLSRK